MEGLRHGNSLRIIDDCRSGLHRLFQLSLGLENRKKAATALSREIVIAR